MSLPNCVLPDLPDPRAGVPVESQISQSAQPFKTELTCALYWARCDFSSSHLRSCGGVPFPDHCCLAAKRQGGGSGRGFWRHGFADSLWPSRLGDTAIESDDDLGNFVYADVNLAFNRCHPEFGYGVRAGAGTPRREDDDRCASYASACATEEVIA